jgi:MOSC domain-containing protein YiiM
MPSTVVSVSRSPTHSFSKFVEPEILLLAGLGVQGDAHAGATVRHRYRVRQDPTAPNLCQVHLLHQELFSELAQQGIDIAPGAMGENVTTTGIDLLALPRNALLTLGDSAVVRITGLRDPCNQMNALRPGLMKACLSRTFDGELVRKSGIMAVVIHGGIVRPGDQIRIQHPDGPPLPLYPV